MSSSLFANVLQQNKPPPKRREAYAADSSNVPLDWHRMGFILVTMAMHASSPRCLRAAAHRHKDLALQATHAINR